MDTDPSLSGGAPSREGEIICRNSTSSRMSSLGSRLSSMKYLYAPFFPYRTIGRFAGSLGKIVSATAKSWSDDMSHSSCFPFWAVIAVPLLFPFVGPRRPASLDANKNAYVLFPAFEHNFLAGGWGLASMAFIGILIRESWLIRCFRFFRGRSCHVGFSLLRKH